MGNHSSKTVIDVSKGNDELRDAHRTLVNDFQITSDSRITINTLPDGNHQATFMLPIEVAGNMAWGVYDKSLGTTAATQNRENWNIRYTVYSVIEGSGAILILSRQILDDAMVLQQEDVVAKHLRKGTDIPPGFRVVKNGEMWEIQLSTIGEEACDQGRKVELHVRTRN